MYNFDQLPNFDDLEVPEENVAALSDQSSLCFSQMFYSVCEQQSKNVLIHDKGHAACKKSSKLFIGEVKLTDLTPTPKECKLVKQELNREDKLKHFNRSKSIITKKNKI